MSTSFNNKLRGGKGVCVSTLVEPRGSAGEGILRIDGVGEFANGGSRIDGSRLGICEIIPNGCGVLLCGGGGCLNISVCMERFIDRGFVIKRMGVAEGTGTAEG